MNLGSGRGVCFWRFRKTSLRRRLWNRGLKELERSRVPGGERPGRGGARLETRGGSVEQSESQCVAAAEWSGQTGWETRSETSIRSLVIEGFASLP